MYYQVEIPSDWPGSPATHRTVEAESPAAAATKAFLGARQLVFARGCGYHVTIGEVLDVQLETAEEICKRGRVHPKPADELLVTWHTPGYEPALAGPHTARIPVPAVLVTAPLA